jgi:hypothetical protein
MAVAAAAAKARSNRFVTHIARAYSLLTKKAF